MLISRFGQQVCFSFFDYSGSQYIGPSQSPTKVNILLFTVEYLDAIIHSKTRYKELEIETNGSSQSQQNLWFHKYVYGFSLTRGRGTGVSTSLKLNKTVLTVWILTAGQLVELIADSSDH